MDFSKAVSEQARVRIGGRKLRLIRHPSTKDCEKYEFLIWSPTIFALKHLLRENNRDEEQRIIRWAGITVPPATKSTSELKKRKELRKEYNMWDGEECPYAYSLPRKALSSELMVHVITLIHGAGTPLGSAGGRGTKSISAGAEEAELKKPPFFFAFFEEEDEGVFKAARMALSNTSLSPCWVSAEHS